MPRNCPRIALFSFFFRLPWMSIFRPIHPRPLALHSCFLHWIVPSPIACFPFPPRPCFVPHSLGSPHASRSFLPRTSIRHTKLGQGFGRFCLRHGEVRTAEDDEPRGIRSTTVHSSLAPLPPSHSLTLPHTPSGAWGWAAVLARGDPWETRAQTRRGAGSNPRTHRYRRRVQPEAPGRPSRRVG